MKSTYRLDPTRPEFANVKPMVEQANRAFELMDWRGTTRAGLGRLLARLATSLDERTVAVPIAYEDLLDRDTFVAAFTALRSAQGRGRLFAEDVQSLLSLLRAISFTDPALPPFNEDLVVYHSFPRQRRRTREPLSPAEENRLRERLIAEVEAALARSRRLADRRPDEPFQAKPRDIIPIALLLIMDGGLTNGSLPELERDCLINGPDGRVAIRAFKPRSQRVIDHGCRSDGASVQWLIDSARELTRDNARLADPPMGGRLLVCRRPRGAYALLAESNHIGRTHFSDQVAAFLTSIGLRQVASGPVSCARLRATFAHQVTQAAGLPEFKRLAGHQRIETSFKYVRTSAMRRECGAFALEMERRLLAALERRKGPQ